MEEIDVISKTHQYLTSHGWKVWIDDHPSLSSLDPKIFERHFITIGSFTPDLIGYDPQGIPFAIEAKGSKQIRKGVGQAIYYSLGASKVFVAQQTGSLDQLKKLARKYNFGLIEVDTSVKIIHEEQELEKPYKEDFEKSLRLLNLGLNETHNQLSSLSRNQLLNYFGPIFLVSEYQSFIEIDNWYQQNQIMKGSVSEIVRGATILGFLRKNSEEYYITPEGDMAKAILKSYNINSVKDIEKAKKRLGKGKHDPFYQDYSAIATMLRIIFLNSPYVKDFLEFIPEESTPMFNILSEMIKKRPNLVVNFLCLKSKRSQCVKFIKNAESSEDSIVDGFVNDYLQHSIISSFKRHLQSIGLINFNSIHSGALVDYKSKSDLWSLSNFDNLRNNDF